MEDENRIIQYCLSDELGSPLRVLYQNGNGDAYGYDEFGVDLYAPEAEQYGGKRYSRQGERQPFGYTGYRHDDISGTYFAQAREYQPEVGRFVSEDVIHGRNTVPKTLNRYGYCWGNPMQYVDLNGEDPITVMIIIGLAVAAALGTTGCGAEFDEEKRVPLPTTFSDYEYEHDLDEYNSKEYKKYTNCYAYVLDIVVDPITGEKFRKHDGSDKWAAQPGMFSPSEPFEADTTKQKYINMITNDIEILGWSIQKYDADSTEDLTGGYFIAMALIPMENEYHFYRQDKDGTWSCKRGADSVESGIEDPQVDAFENGYDLFGGYFYIIKECE
ncbi:MAG: RHS repeat-associated core domain-containing protein [Lachnospiraceae bacterium]|nr:RHS repeat-associated core domain-containing protein [Lachnospiraceae bacterium]